MERRKFFKSVAVGVCGLIGVNLGKLGNVEEELIIDRYSPKEIAEIMSKPLRKSIFWATIPITVEGGLQLIPQRATLSIYPSR